MLVDSGGMLGLWLRSWHNMWSSYLIVIICQPLLKCAWQHVMTSVASTDVSIMLASKLDLSKAERRDDLMHELLIYACRARNSVVRIKSFTGNKRSMRHGTSLRGTTLKNELLKLTQNGLHNPKHTQQTCSLVGGLRAQIWPRETRLEVRLWGDLGITSCWCLYLWRTQVVSL